MASQSIICRPRNEIPSVLNSQNNWETRIWKSNQSWPKSNRSVIQFIILFNFKQFASYKTVWNGKLNLIKFSENFQSRYPTKPDQKSRVLSQLSRIEILEVQRYFWKWDGSRQTRWVMSKSLPHRHFNLLLSVTHTHRQSNQLPNDIFITISMHRWLNQFA